MNRIQRIALVAGGLAVFTGVVGTGVVLAQDPPTPVTAQSRVDSYIAQLAKNLNISEDALRAALKQTGLDILDKAVADGDISQARADAIRAQIEAGDGNPFGFGIGHGEKRGGPHIGGPGFAIHDGVAEFLGIDEQALHTALQSGQTLAQIAEANGKTREALRTLLVDQHAAAVDQAAANGRITAAQATELKDAFAIKIDALMDGTMPMGGPRGGPGHHGHFEFHHSAPPTAPSTTTNVQ